MIMGRQLFLKKLTSCFLFSKEDMVSLPSWIQIHGLPANCWTTQALSRIASVVGKPIHTDKLAISKKGHNYARVPVELDAKKSRILDYSIKLPTGKQVVLKFIYELEPKFCDRCDVMGHTLYMCGKKRIRMGTREEAENVMDARGMDLFRELELKMGKLLLEGGFEISEEKACRSAIT